MRNPALAFLGCLLVCGLQNMLFATAGQVYIEPPNGTKFAVGANKTIGYSNGPREYDDSPCCRPGDPDETWKKEGAPVVTFTGPVDSTGKLDTSTSGDKTVTVKVRQKWTCPGGGEEYTEDTDTGTYTVTNSFFANILSPSDGDVKSTGALSIQGEGGNGTLPYTLTWTLTADGATVTANPSTQSQSTDTAPNPTSAAVPFSVTGKELSIQLEVKDSSNPPQTTTKTIKLYYPKFKVTSLIVTSDHGVMTKEQNDYKSEGGDVYGEPEYDRNRGTTYPISHTTSTNGAVKLKINVLPATMPSKKFKVGCPSGIPGFQFEMEKDLAGGDNDNVTFSSSSVTQNKIGTLTDVLLDWEFYYGSNKVGGSGSATFPKIYLTLGQPASTTGAPGKLPSSAGITNTPTEARIRWSCLTAKDKTTPQEVVAQVATKVYPLGQSRTGSEWGLVSDWPDSECIDNVVFWLNVCAMLGVTEPGIQYLYPDPRGKNARANNEQGKETTQTLSRTITENGHTQTINTTGYYMFSNPGNPLFGNLVANRFEACMYFNGTYYAGNTSHTGTTPKEVFEKMGIEAGWATQKLVPSNTYVPGKGYLIYRLILGDWNWPSDSDKTGPSHFELWENSYSPTPPP